MNGPELVLGVDGGMTKTIALIARTDGQIVGWARGPGSNLYSGTADDCGEILAAIAGEAAAMAGARLDDLQAAGLSLSGADCPADIVELTEQAAVRKLGMRHRVVNDSVGALYAACPTGPGAVAVCGTGFTAAARAESGREWAGGHWTDWASSRGRGYLGGQAMAEAAVRVVVDAELDLGPATNLSERLLDSIGVDTVGDLLHAVTARGVYHAELRSDLTEQLLLAANDGDGVAVSVVEDFGASMGDLVGVAVTRAGALAESFDLALMGSVLRAPCPTLRTSLLQAVDGRVANFRAIDTERQPAHGAVMIALELAGVTLAASVLDAITDSSPDPGLFHTTAGRALISNEGC